MKEPNRHKALLRFASEVAEIVAKYSVEELMDLHRHSLQGFKFMTSFIDATIEAARMGETDMLIEYAESGAMSKSPSRGLKSNHLFDLLRAKELFDTNADLADFAQRLFRGMASKRYDKMSRGEIAVHIVEYIENQSPMARRQLESMLRKALKNRRFARTGADESFFSEWQRIIKTMGRS